MKRYYRVRLGEKGAYADQCFADNFIGVHYDIDVDLTDQLPEQVQDFNKIFRPIWLEKHPGKSKVAAGLSCGVLHKVCKGIREGDLVLCPDGNGAYRVGEITGAYTHHPGEILPHRRAVRWLSDRIQRTDMPDVLRKAGDIPITAIDITPYAEEIEGLLGGAVSPTLIATNENVEDPTVFALEAHLEEFLVTNWQSTPLGKDYDIYEEDGELIGQQYPTDTGRLDILAVSKNKKELLIVELKKGRASDKVVGQVQRYMGYVLDELAEPDQTVRGVIIALDDDLRIRRALRVARDIEFYRYEVSFALMKVEL